MADLLSGIPLGASSSSPAGPTETGGKHTLQRPAAKVATTAIMSSDADTKAAAGTAAACERCEARRMYMTQYNASRAGGKRNRSDSASTGPPVNPWCLRGYGDDHRTWIEYLAHHSNQRACDAVDVQQRQLSQAQDHAGWWAYQASLAHKEVDRLRTALQKATSQADIRRTDLARQRQQIASQIRAEYDSQLTELRAEIRRLRGELPPVQRSSKEADLQQEKIDLGNALSDAEQQVAHVRQMFEAIPLALLVKECRSSDLSVPFGVFNVSPDGYPYLQTVNEWLDPRNKLFTLRLCDPDAERIKEMSHNKKRTLIDQGFTEQDAANLAVIEMWQEAGVTAARVPLIEWVDSGAKFITTRLQKKSSWQKFTPLCAFGQDINGATRRIPIRLTRAVQEELCLGEVDDSILRGENLPHGPFAPLGKILLRRILTLYFHPGIKRTRGGVGWALDNHCFPIVHFEKL